MCGRFYIDSECEANELAQVIDTIGRKPEALGVRTSGEVCPGDVIAVLAGTQIVPMRWGYRVDRRLVINARSETMGEKPMFMRGGRCLIPASGYYEWNAAKQRYAYGAQGGVLYMAGLFRMEPGERIARCVILTRAAVPEFASVHERMPVLLGGADRRAWLNGAPVQDILARAHACVTQQAEIRP